MNRYSESACKTPGMTTKGIGTGLLVLLIILAMMAASGCGGKQLLVAPETIHQPGADQGGFADGRIGVQDARDDNQEGWDGGDFEPQQQVPRQQEADLKLNLCDGGFFSAMLPDGWRLQAMGQYSTFGFRARDPDNPDYQIFYYGSLAPLNKSYEAKALWMDYVNGFGYPTARLNADAPVVNPYDAGSIFYSFNALNGMSEKYGLGFSFPGLAYFAKRKEKAATEIALLFMWVLFTNALPVHQRFCRLTHSQSRRFGNACRPLDDGKMAPANLTREGMPFNVRAADITRKEIPESCVQPYTFLSAGSVNDMHEVTIKAISGKGIWIFAVTPIDQNAGALGNAACLRSRRFQ